jgi:hypothetical protein
MEDSWNSGRESRAGKPVFSPLTPEERAAKNLVYEQLKSEAMALGLSTEGGIGALKNRIRDFRSIEGSTEEASTEEGSTWRAGRPSIEHARGPFHGIRTEARKGRGGGRFVAFGHEGRAARAEERRQKSLNYAFKIGCDLDGDESEEQIQEAIQAHKEAIQANKKAIQARKERKAAAKIESYIREARRLGIDTDLIEKYSFDKDRVLEELKTQIGFKKEEEWGRRIRETAERKGVSGASYRSAADLAEELGRIGDERRARRAKERDEMDERDEERMAAEYAERARSQREYELYEAKQRMRDPDYDRKKKEREYEERASYMQHIDSACL